MELLPARPAPLLKSPEDGRGRGQSDCPRLACSPKAARTCPASAVGLGPAFSAEPAHSPPQWTRSGPGPGTIALRDGGVGLSSVAAANPPPSLSGRLREPGACSALPAGVRRRRWGARRRSLGRGGDDRGPGSCPSARGSGPWTAGAELLPAEELPL